MSDSGILKDNEDSIPTKTAIARWAERAFKAEAEIDRLRAELEETMRGAKDAQGIAEHWTREADRLRAELESILFSLEELRKNDADEDMLYHTMASQIERSLSKKTTDAPLEFDQESQKRE